MGQYYEAVIADPKQRGRRIIKNYRRYYPHDFGCGSKLMEHSIVGNWFTMEVEEHIYQYGPRRVLWFGDYTYDNPSDCIEAKNRNGILPSMEEIDKIPENKPEFFIDDDHYDDNFKNLYEHAFLVNHTQKLYVDMAKFIKANSYEVEGYDSRKKSSWRAKWCADPLPILTATVNHSGGSYYGPDMDKACSWTWDIISIEDEPPSGYKEVTCNFKDYGNMTPKERKAFDNSKKAEEKEEE